MPDVQQTISDFYRVATERDFSRDFQFRVLSIDAGGASSTTFDEDDLVYCTAGSLPARSITNVAVPYMGLQFNVPGNATYPGSENYSLQFYCDQNSQIRQKFEDMSRDIFDDATSTGNYFTPRQSSSINLVQLDTQLEEVAGYKLVGASVREVGAIEYDISGGTGAQVTFGATMAYHYFRRTNQ
tara:strand:+ start:408 stop:959 length:552 start_codon:yes stop_codon:yes gene_type:complete